MFIFWRHAILADESYVWDAQRLPVRKQYVSTVGAGHQAEIVIVDVISDDSADSVRDSGWTSS